MPPNRSTGSYQKRLDKVLGFDAATAEQYRLGVPGHSKYDLSRTVNNLCTIPAHEALFDEMGSDELAELEDFEEVSLLDCFAGESRVTGSSSLS